MTDVHGADTKELSGAQWCSRFPGSTDVGDLDATWRPKVVAFLSAMAAAQASYNISATRRPQQRAYLMHWAWHVARGLDKARDVPPMAGVNIEWVHSTDEQSVNAAGEMVQEYAMKYDAALNSNHVRGLAIDMSIGWNATLSIRKGDGTAVDIKSTPRTGMNPMLWEVGKSYEVYKLADDPPHWSYNGHLT